jgi:phosphoglycolate phosphatase
MPGALIIFDFDGTLADTWRDIFTALNQTLHEAGLAPAAGAQVRHWIGNGVAKLIERALPDGERDQQRIDALVARFRLHYERTVWRPRPSTTAFPSVWLDLPTARSRC